MILHRKAENSIIIVAVFVLLSQMSKFVKTFVMALQVEELEDQSKYRKILEVSYDDLIPFIFDYIKRITGVTTFFWSVCFVFLCTALRIRMNLVGYFPLKDFFLHSFLGVVVFPVICVPFHELLHVLPYYISGARNIRIGMDLRQYLFYVTAHRHVASPLQFRIVALFPFILISITMIILVLMLPGLWKWSLSLFLFVHSTMCAGDFALLNFYSIKKGRKIYTWDDADQKIAYFYEEI